MRYLVQFIVPVLVFAAVVYLLRRREHGRRGDGTGTAPASDTGAALVILALGAVVATVTALALQSFWS